MGFFTATQATTQTAQTVPNLTGGTNGRVVRISASNTCVDASYNNTTIQLNAVLIKSGDVYYSSGLVSGFSGLTPGASYFLGSDGTLVSSPPTPSTTVRVLYIGFAINTTTLMFRPGIPISGV
jgi:hypothetical protein